MKRYAGLLAASFMTLALCLAPAYSSDGRSRKKKDRTAEAAAPEKSPYEKFTGKKGLLSAAGEISVYADGDKIYIEFPDSLMGREICMSSHVVESSDQMFAEGLEITGKSADFIVSRTDSAVVFRIPRPTYLASRRDSSMLRALEISGTDAVGHVFPIKYRNADSTAVVFEATGLFDSSDDSSVNLHAAWFANSQIVESTRVDEMSEIVEVKSFPGSVAVVQDATYDVELHTGYKSRLSATMVTTLSVLRRSMMPVREADSRIGLRTVRARRLDSRTGSENIGLATRWDLRDGKKIRVYVDTLLPVSWQNAVREGICAWNPAFEQAGLGTGAVEVLPYPSDSTFSAFNPSVSTVSFCGGGARNISAAIDTDGRTGEIRKFSIKIPGDYLLGLLFSTSFTIGDADPRFTSYELPDDAVCDVLRAQVMRIFGFCIGLGRNCAGSLAYTPDELRSPDFTREHGITASVMDNVLFNTFAGPGDRERGLVTIVDRVGPYDRFAVEWLYGSYAADGSDREALDSLAASKAGQREYLYVPLQSGSPDPRANEFDLGSDPFASFDAAMSHLRFAAANADRWFDSPDIPEENFRQLYVEWMWLKLIDNTKILSPLAGGVFSGDIRAGGSAPHFEAVPDNVQREAVRKVLGAFTDISWLDANKGLMDMSGAYSTYSGLTRMNAVGQSRLLSRMPYMARAQRLAGSGYTREAFLSDFQDAVMAGVSAGRLEPQEDDMVFRYLRALAAMSPVMKSNFDRSFRMDSKSLSDGLHIPLSGVSDTDVEGQDIIARKALEKARKTLVRGRAAAKDAYTAGRIAFLIHVVDVSLSGTR